MGLTVISRLFQAGATAQSYDMGKFKRAAKAFWNILHSDDVKRLIIVTNTEAGNKLAEVVNTEGVAPTTLAIQSEFVAEGDRVVAVQYDQWGKNPGSAMAVTYGCREAIRRGEKDYIMPWSSELAVTPAQIARALAFAESRSLDVVGFHRENWFLKLQYHVFQNTGAIYSVGTLVDNEFFSADCDGNTGRTLEVPGFGTVPLAGMDDFHFLLRALKNQGSVRWGMVCRNAPLPWNVNFEPGSERALQHAQKVARQEAVMYAWIKDLFGEELGIDTMDAQVLAKISDEQLVRPVLARIFAGMQMD